MLVWKRKVLEQWPLKTKRSLASGELERTQSQPDPERQGMQDVRRGPRWGGRS